MSELNNIGVDVPRFTNALSSNFKARQIVDSSEFYSMIPAPYYNYYNNFVRQNLRWYDGYVPEVHSGGMLSTCIGTAIVNKVADTVFGGNLMFANSRKPVDYIDKDGKRIGKALDFISNEWSKEVDFRSHIKRALRDAFAGGFSLVKLNGKGGRLWVENLRADRFVVDISSSGDIRRVVCWLQFFENFANKNDTRRYYLCEERYYEKLGLAGEEKPMVCYKVYQTTAQIQFFGKGNPVCWNDLPKYIKEAVRSEYDFEVDKPKCINGFDNLGVYLLKGSDDISSMSYLGLGESILNNIQTYLVQYDYYATCLNTEMYLGRGRVIVPKRMKSPNANNVNPSANAGLDSFLYTEIETLSLDEQKPLPIQFEIRSEQWGSIEKQILTNIASSINISPSTLNPSLQDGSQKTAREVSAEENSTTMFVENARKRFDKPLNALIADVLKYYGFVDTVNVRWSRAGMTNQTVLVDTLARAVASGLISKKKAHHLFNYDDDEEQNEDDYKLVEQETAQNQNSLFGGLDM